MVLWANSRDVVRPRHLSLWTLSGLPLPRSPTRFALPSHATSPKLYFIQPSVGLNKCDFTLMKVWPFLGPCFLGVFNHMTICLVLGPLAFDLQNVKDNETRKEGQKLVGQIGVVHVFLFNVAGRRLATLNRKKWFNPNIGFHQSCSRFFRDQLDDAIAASLRCRQEFPSCLKILKFTSGVLMLMQSNPQFTLCPRICYNCCTIWPTSVVRTPSMKGIAEQLEDLELSHPEPSRDFY